MSFTSTEGKKVSQRITASVKKTSIKSLELWYDSNNDVKDKRPFWKNIIAVTIVILESYREKGYRKKYYRTKYYGEKITEERSMNKCKKAVSVLLIAAMLVLMLSGCGGKTVTTENTGSSEYRVCMITDAGDITDQSFNQTTYEACRDYCKEHDIDFTYKKPDGDTDYARTAMVDVAVAEGYNILVMPGYVFAQTVVDTTFN